MGFDAPTQKLSLEDKEKIESFFPLADTISSLIGEHCEVVIHSLEALENSVVKISNGSITGRTIGSPITDLGLKMLAQYEQNQNQVQEGYFAKNAKGDELKSATFVITGSKGLPIGLFCMNINLSAPFSEVLKAFLPSVNTPPVQELFSSNATDVISESLKNTIIDVDNDSKVMPKQRNKEITRRLFENGIFELKEATQLTALELNISKHAIYKYIREFKS
jgi:predicted transcriptional regulator YheO